MLAPPRTLKVTHINSQEHSIIHNFLHNEKVNVKVGHQQDLLVSLIIRWYGSVEIVSKVHLYLIQSKDYKSWRMWIEYYGNVIFKFIFMATMDLIIDSDTRTYHDWETASHRLGSKRSYLTL